MERSPSIFSFSLTLLIKIFIALNNRYEYDNNRLYIPLDLLKIVEHFFNFFRERNLQMERKWYNI